MAEFRLGRLKFNWRDAWVGSTAYVIDDLVRFGANSYVCVGNHTSQALAANFTSDAAYWQLHTGGFESKGDWTASTAYVQDDIVKEGGNMYICTNQHTSSGLASAFEGVDLPANWKLFQEGLNFTGAFSTSTYYGVNDVVTFGPREYRCTASFQTPTDWVVNVDGLSSGTDAFYPPAQNFSQISAGYENKGAYIATERYQRGDIVEWKGSTYVAISSNPVQQQPNESENDWSFLNLGIGTGGQDAWNTGLPYSKGQIVRFGGNTYQADILKIEPNNRPTGIGSTTIDNGINGWALLNRGFSWTGAYTTTTIYEIGDIAEYQSSAYISVASTNVNVEPGTSVNCWQAFAIGDSAALLTTKGDLLTRNATGPTRLGIGTAGTFLKAGNTNEAEWQYTGKLTKTYYVDPELGQDTNSGESPDAAFRTIAYATTSTNPKYDITNAIYDGPTGICTITAAGHGLYAGQEVKLVGLAFTCDSGLGPSSIFPSGKGGDFFFGVEEVIDTNTFSAMVGVATIPHTYVSGGEVTNAAPVILKLSAGRFDEQLPMTLGKNFCIAGDVLRGSTIRPAEGLSNDGVTPNSRSTMFFVSDAVTVQGITMRGMEGFDYDVNDPFNTAKMQNKVGVGTTACGVYLRFNPDESVIKRSAYIKDCTCFGHNTTDGTGHGGAIGVYLEGGVHHKNPEGKGYKSMVFDSFTNVMSGGVGIYLEDDAVAEIVSCFTYYCAYGYISDTGSEIRSLSSNNSYGTYGALACGFSTHEVARPGKVYGDKMELLPGQTTGTVAVGATIRGTESGARGTITNDQSSSDSIYFKYFVGFGNTSSDPTVTPNGAIGIGTTVFKPGEAIEIDSVGAGATGWTKAASAANAIQGQKGILMELTGLTTSLTVGDALGFSTTGMGFSDTFSYIVRTSTNYVEPSKLDVYDAQYTPQSGIMTVFTTTNHGLEFGDFIRIKTGSLHFECNVGGGGSAAYPRVADPVADIPLEISGVGNTFFAVQVLNDKNSPTENVPSTFTGIHTYIGGGGVGKTSVEAITIGDGRATINIAPGKANSPTIGLDDQRVAMRSKFSKIRLTGHDFLLIGTGNTTTTNYPNVDENSAAQGQETNIVAPGRIYFVSTDQGGNFRVGEYFSVNQLTGAATLDASAFNLSGLTELKLGAIGGQIGESISEFSSDETMGGDSNSACPTEKAVRGFLTRARMDGTSGIIVPPRGTQATRPTGVDLYEGGLRYDTDANGLEFYNGSDWLPLGAYANVTTTSGVTLANKQQVFANTTSGGFTVTLPASPVKGDSVRIFDSHKTFDSNALTIGRNGNPIMGDNADLTVTTEGAAFEMVFFDGSQGWRIITI
tara:strand:- start:4357 stop:8367 length:4011 start_codon:yes stop_codon:yes gene_type:complete